MYDDDGYVTLICGDKKLRLHRFKVEKYYGPVSLGTSEIRVLYLPPICPHCKKGILEPWHDDYWLCDECDSTYNWRPK